MAFHHQMEIGKVFLSSTTFPTFPHQNCLSTHTHTRAYTHTQAKLLVEWTLKIGICLVAPLSQAGPSLLSLIHLFFFCLIEYNQKRWKRVSSPSHPQPFFLLHSLSFLSHFILSILSTTFQIIPTTTKGGWSAREMEVTNRRERERGRGVSSAEANGHTTQVKGKAKKKKREQHQGNITIPPSSSLLCSTPKR